MPKIESNDKATFLGSADLEVSPKDAQAVRDVAQKFSTCLAGLVDFLEEPLKGKFLEVKAQLNTMLAGLPATDMVPAAHEGNYILRNLLGALSNAQSMISVLSDATKSAKGEVGTVRASIPNEVKVAIEAKITSGELLTKDQATKNVQDAVSAARGAWENELKTISDRRTSLASANLPVPADAHLAGEDKDFTAKKERAASRIEQLKGFSLSSARVAELAWEADDNSFKNTLDILKEATSNKGGNKPAAGANPFVKPAAEAASIRKLGAF